MRYMTRITFVVLFVLTTLNLQAQPEIRRKQQQEAAKKTNANNVTLRQRLSFPTALPMSEDVVWRRDVYRELDLTNDKNAALYYPTEPNGTTMNLFTMLFKWMMVGPDRGGIAAYKYTLDGNENFSDENRVKPLDFLKDNDIYFERTDKGVHIADADIPSKDVKAYYIKESAFFDQTSGTFHTKVLAICPVMAREDDFGDHANRYPLFWVKYEDLEPLLSKQRVMVSNVNNAATMSLSDYFSTASYRGKIYKTNNMLGQTLSQYCKTDSALSKEQKRIEQEIEAFESNIWGDKAQKDSLDSIARLDKKALKTLKKNRRTARTSERTVSRRRTSRTSETKESGSARVTVRRQRH